MHVFLIVTASSDQGPKSKRPYYIWIMTTSSTPRPPEESADCLLTPFSCGIFGLIFVLVRSPQPSKILKRQSNTLFAGEVLLLQYVIKIRTSLLQISTNEYFNQNVLGF